MRNSYWWITTCYILRMNHGDSNRCTYIFNKKEQKKSCFQAQSREGNKKNKNKANKKNVHRISGQDKRDKYHYTRWEHWIWRSNNGEQVWGIELQRLATKGKTVKSDTQRGKEKKEEWWEKIAVVSMEHINHSPFFL